MDVENHTYNAQGVCTVCGYARPSSGGSGGGGEGSGGGGSSRATSAPDGSTTTILDDDVPLTDIARVATATLNNPTPDYTSTAEFTTDTVVTVTVKDNQGNPVSNVAGGIVVRALSLKDGEVVVVLDKDGNEIELLEKSLVDGGTAYFLLDASATVTIRYNAKAFSDMNESMTSYNAVRFVSSHELFNGYSDGTFHPSDAMNRSMLVAVLWRLENKPTPGKQTMFLDTNASAYYAEAMKWATENNITHGYSDGNFRPYAPITRQAMAALMYRYMNYAGFDTTTRSDLSKFSDNSKVSSYAADPLQWAVGADIINGKADGTLDLLGNATRAQVALMMQRMVSAMVKDTDKPVANGSV